MPMMTPDERAEGVRKRVAEMRASLDLIERALDDQDWPTIGENAVSLTDDATDLEQFADDGEKAAT